mmetsp:Transcript_103954/g.318461  ORF Transcript_103954/g.318461 Transcript_103954/m.318461 type:complete len:122 (-) Transcript_103954:183-548(-)
MPQGGSFITRFVGMCTGLGNRSSTRAPSEPPSLDAARLPGKEGHPEKTLLTNPGLKHPTALKHPSAAKEPCREVHVDKTTAVPLDLYWELLRAGERIKDGGQHKLTGHRTSKPRLVNSGVD